MGVIMMVMFQGRMMSTDEVLKIRNNTKPLIETTDKPKGKVKKEVVDLPKEKEKPVIADELEQLRAEYKDLFGRKAHHMAGIDTLKEKIAKASEA